MEKRKPERRDRAAAPPDRSGGRMCDSTVRRSTVYNRTQYGFPVLSDLNYETIPAVKFKRYLSGYGKTRLLQIKYKYFSDKMLALWELCYTFFDQSHRITISTARKEYLLAKNFNIVFEAMIDELIGDKRKDLPNGLKDQEDGKIVDHMYSYRGLTNNDEQDRNVYYIGDSKYYKMGNVVGTESVAKQFTYARNVIQWNLNIFLDEDSPDRKYRERFPKLRDDVTEGYNIVPNFFISAMMNKDLKYSEGNIERRKGSELVSRQFENRLFDRDTLIIAHYDINFLFIVSLYARANASAKLAWKEKMRKRFRTDIQEMLQDKFKFYAITPLAATDPDSFFREHFQQLLGKVFAPYNDTNEKTTFYSLALLDTTPRSDDTAKEKARKKLMAEENEAVLECVSDAFEIAECRLGVDPSTKVAAHAAAPYAEIPKPMLTRHHVSNYSADYILFGCIKNDGGIHRDWVFKTRSKYKRSAIYNVRLGDRPGAVKRGDEKVRTPRFVVMYEEADDKSFRVFRVHHALVVKKERMERMEYPHPNGDYFCYFLDEEVSLGELDVHKIRMKYKHLRDPKHQFAPLYLTGNQVMAV